MKRSAGYLKWAAILLAIFVAAGWLPLEVANGLKAILLTQ